MATMASRSAFHLPKAWSSIITPSGCPSHPRNLATNSGIFHPGQRYFGSPAATLKSSSRTLRGPYRSSKCTELLAVTWRHLKCYAVWDSPPSVSSTDPGLREAAVQTVDLFVKSGMVVGLGSGPASQLAVEYIGQQMKRGALHDIVGVPSCASSAALAAQAGIPLSTLEANPKLNFAFTDADLVQEGTLFGVVGRRPVLPGCDSIFLEKAIATSAEKFAFLVQGAQFVEKLNGAIPILIRSEEWLEVAEEIDDTFLGEAEVWRRPATGTAGPMGGDFPLLTPEGHFILDLIFSEPIEDASELASLLESISGVVAHGLFLDQADTAAVAKGGEVLIRTSRFRQAFITSTES